MKQSDFVAAPLRDVAGRFHNFHVALLIVSCFVLVVIAQISSSLDPEETSKRAIGMGWGALYTPTDYAWFRDSFFMATFSLVLSVVGIFSESMYYSIPVAEGKMVWLSRWPRICSLVSFLCNIVVVLLLVDKLNLAGNILSKYTSPIVSASSSDGVRTMLETYLNGSYEGMPALNTLINAQSATWTSLIFVAVWVLGASQLLVLMISSFVHKRVQLDLWA